MIFTNLLIKTYKYKNIYSKFPFFFPISVVSKTLLGKQMQIEVTQLISQYPANLILSSLIKKIPGTLHPHITQQITGPPSFTLKNHPSLNPRVSHPFLRNSKTEFVSHSHFIQFETDLASLSEDLLGGSGDSWGFADEGYQGILIYTQVPQ